MVAEIQPRREVCPVDDLHSILRKEVLDLPGISWRCVVAILYYVAQRSLCLTDLWLRRKCVMPGFHQHEAMCTTVEARQMIRQKYRCSVVPDGATDSGPCDAATKGSDGGKTLWVSEKA